MLKLPITYVNFLGETKTKDFYFNLSKAELTERTVGSDGEFQATLERIKSSNKGSVVLPELVKIIKWSYGEISADGEQFLKTEEGWTRFESSPAYSELIMRFFSTDGGTFAASFINGVLPADLAAQAREQAAQNGFRPGADLSRPTPPVAGVQTLPENVSESPLFQPPVQQPVQQPMQEAIQIPQPPVYIQEQQPQVQSSPRDWVPPQAQQ